MSKYENITIEDCINNYEIAHKSSQFDADNKQIWFKKEKE